MGNGEGSGERYKINLIANGGRWSRVDLARATGRAAAKQPGSNGTNGGRISNVGTYNSQWCWCITSSRLSRLHDQ